MKITKFAVLLAKKERGKRQVDIAQIMEILSKINKLLNGCLYKLISWRDLK